MWDLINFLMHKFPNRHSENSRKIRKAVEFQKNKTHVKRIPQDNINAVFENYDDFAMCEFDVRN